jgi:fused signal recognition particle receptor
MFGRLKEKLKQFSSSVKKEKKPRIRTTTKLKKALGLKLTEKDLEQPLWDLHLALLESDVSLEVAEEICDGIKKELLENGVKGNVEDAVQKAIKDALEGELSFETYDLVDKVKHSEKPYIMLFVGPNGSGKTTTIAKIANLFKKNGLSCVIAAADTFRAASIEQLEVHGNRLGVRVIKHKYGSDPTAVAYDAVKHAEAKKLDAVLVDTAGRQQTNLNLIEEMRKIERVIAPQLKIFVGESIAGSTIIEQVRDFNEAIGLDGVILAKLDVDEKGGTAISISKTTGVPIIYVGTGQDYDALERFDKEKIIKAILS